MRHWLTRVAIASGLAMSALSVVASAGQTLPPGFVYLSAVDATIRQDMRYAKAENFTGAVVDGYEAPECVLTRVTAEALARAHKRLAVRHPGHVLKVFDCYRPVRAVRGFAAWSKVADATGETGFYHPSISKKRLFALGYIAAQSGHSRGNVVDITIERIEDPVPTATGTPSPTTEASQTTDGAPAVASVCTAPGAGAARSPDSVRELDMGTAFDCFDTKSNTHSGALTAEQKRARRMLLEVMGSAGFRNFPKEWWHFVFPPGAARTAQDFAITAKP